MVVDREAVTEPPPSPRDTLPETPRSKPPPAGIDMAAVEYVVERTLQRFRKLVQEDITLAYEATQRTIRKLRDDVTSLKIERELQDTPTGAAEDVTVLIVDDDPGMLLALRRLLESRSMKVFDASGPDAAMNVLDLEPIDVVLTDVRMPKNGEMLFEYVRSAHPGCEVVLMSGGEESETADKCLQAGAFDFINKPFPSIERVVLTITRAAEHRRARRRDQRR